MAVIPQPASLGDYVWLDNNNDGQQNDGAASGFAGVTVELYNSTGWVASTVTNSTGYYLFQNLSPGDYRVKFILPSGYAFTTKGTGTNTDSDADSFGWTVTTTLVSGENDLSWDAGFVRLASLGDYVWVDGDHNGLQDDGAASGLNGVTVELYNGAGALVGSTVTANDGGGNAGYYLFTGLVPGDYSVKFIKPDGYTFAQQDQGGNDAADSDANASGVTVTTTLVSGENDLGWDAGLVRLASLGDRIWLDTNANGQQDDGATGVSGLLVTLVGGGADGVINGVGDSTATTTTGADGYYQFTGLTPGMEYQVHFSKPTGAVYTGTNIGNDATDSDADASGKSQVVTLGSGENNATLDAGFYSTASLGDYVWVDGDHNGLQDDGAASGLNGVTVELYNGAGALVGNTVTANDGGGNAGYYLFTGLVPGDYSVKFIKPDGYTFAQQDQGGNDGADSDANASGVTVTTTLVSGENDLGWDAGVVKLASIGDYVWEDSNANGVQDSGETGKAGVTVELYACVNDAPSGAALASVTTGSDGAYSFTSLVPGDYLVKFIAADGSVLSTANAGNDALDSDADGVTGLTGCYQLSPGENETSADAGFYSTASLGDYVWVDGDHNGLQDDGAASGLNGVTVELYNGAGALVGSTVTANDGGGNAGYYLFSNLVPGDYSVKFIKPDGYTFAQQDQGGNDGADSDANASGVTVTTTLVSGENDLGWDAGVVKLASIGDYVWEDSNANGVQDSGETGKAGVTVELYACVNDAPSGAALASVTTGSDGAYSFTGLVPGDYLVKFIAADGSVLSTANAGNDALDSDADGVTGLTGCYQLAPGENNTTADAGFYQTASLGDYVWYDKDVDGIQDASETGIGGVTVTLAGGGADGLLSTLADNTVSTTTTGLDGSYLFDGLTPGTQYQVAFSTPDGFNGTSPRQQGVNPAIDSDGVLSDEITLASGEFNQTIDAGFFKVGIDIEKWVHSQSTVENPGGGEGLTPGFWKNHSSYGPAPLTGWPETGFSPDASYEAIFGVNVSGSNPTLLEALGMNGGGESALLRHSAAALLNASDAYVDYAYSAAQVIAMTQAAFANGTFETTKDLFATQNELGADLTDLATSSTTVINGADMDADLPGSGPTIGAGDKAVFTYIVTNTGDSAIGNVVVTDDRLANVTFVGGDVDHDGLLDLNETWIYTATETVAGTTGEISNIGTVTGTSVVAGGPSVTDSDAAHYSVGSFAVLGDKVWEDTNANGTQDTGENGIAGVTVQLNDNFGNVLKTTTTDVNGNYLFDVVAGVYSVTVVTPSSYLVTSKDKGGNDASDSDIDATTKTTAAVTITDGEVNLSLDAGLYRTAALGDRIWLDTNANGQQDDGATGVSGLLVTLIGGGADGVINGVGDTTATTTTGTDGFYQFTALTPGVEYQVQFSKPTGSSYTSANIGNDASDSDADVATGKSQVVTLSSGENNVTLDAGIVQAATASLGDRIWLDKNGNGQQDAGETGTSGLLVTLIGGGADGVINGVGDTMATTTTGADGIYAFTGLAASTQYQVLFSKPAGSIFTKTNIGNDASDSDANTATGKSQVVTLSSGENNTTLDAGYYTAACLGDRIWLDKNGNGQQDSGETGTSGLLVTLIGGGADGVINGVGDTTATTTTGTNGIYSFTGLTPGMQYQVLFSKPTGSVFTKANIGNDASDSDANTVTAKSQVVTLGSGENNTTLDAGYYSKCSVGDKVWDDMNHNNIQDASEPGIGNITVKLMDATGTNVLATTTTNSSGNYLFANLDPGTYVLQFDKTNVMHYNYGAWYNMNGWKWAVKDTGSNDSVDSDVAGNAISTTNVTKTSAFTLVSGQNDMTRDAGITPIVIDLNGDGVHTVARSASTGSFDWFGNGTAIQSGWLSSQDGFLAIDNNGNGKIDSISELFGGQNKGDGFAKLGSFDSNGDGLVNLNDADFANLRIWQDANGNHQTDAGELVNLAEAGVVSLKASFIELPFIDGQGNLHLERSNVTLADGSAADMTDVYFNVSADDASAAGFQVTNLGSLAGTDSLWMA